MWVYSNLPLLSVLGRDWSDAAAAAAAVHMFQCYCLNSSHSLLPPLCPKSVLCVCTTQFYFAKIKSYNTVLFSFLLNSIHILSFLPKDRLHGNFNGYLIFIESYIAYLTNFCFWTFIIFLKGSNRYVMVKSMVLNLDFPCSDGSSATHGWRILRKFLNHSVAGFPHR